MTEYFQIVRATDRPVAILEHAEWGSARVHCLRTGARLQFEIGFPDDERLDRFLASARHKNDIRRNGGRIAVCTPQHLLADASPEQLEKSSILKPEVVASIFRVTQTEFKAAQALAYAAIARIYREKK